MDPLGRAQWRAGNQIREVENMIETLTPREAADYLRSIGMGTSAETIRKGIEQGVFPFGDAVKTGEGYTYYIYRGRLERWIRDVETREGEA